MPETYAVDDYADIARRAMELKDTVKSQKKYALCTSREIPSHWLTVLSTGMVHYPEPPETPILYDSPEAALEDAAKRAFAWSSIEELITVKEWTSPTTCSS